jgi:hypothetical protein
MYKSNTLSFWKPNKKWVSLDERRNIEYTQNLEYARRENSLLNKAKELLPQLILLAVVIGLLYYLNSIVQNIKLMQAYLKELIRLMKEKKDI